MAQNKDIFEIFIRAYCYRQGNKWLLELTSTGGRPWKGGGRGTSLSSSTGPNGKPEINENERQQLIQ